MRSQYGYYGRRRRLDGFDIGIRVATGVVALGLVGGVGYAIVEAATDDDVDEVEMCSTLPPAGQQPVRADQALCDANTPGYGAYTWQIPDDDDSSTIILWGVGQPLPMPGTAGGGRYGKPTTSKVLRPANTPNTVTATPKTISRGGLGVVSSGSSSGGKAGSSGS